MPEILVLLEPLKKTSWAKFKSSNSRLIPFSNLFASPALTHHHLFCVLLMHSLKFFFFLLSLFFELQHISHALPPFSCFLSFPDGNSVKTNQQQQSTPLSIIYKQIIPPSSSSPTDIP
jgi:hypothetical protein